MNDNRTFATRLRQAIKTNGTTQEKLARAVGVTVKTVNRWAAGDDIRSENLKQVAAALGVTADWLIGNDQPDPMLERIDRKLTRIIKHLGLDDEDDNPLDTEQDDDDTEPLAA